VLETREPLQPAGEIPVPLAERFIVAGSSTARTSVASIRTAAASPTPNCLKNSIESVPKIAKTLTGARGALLMYSCLPVSEFGQAWPEGVPVQVHGKEGDEFFLEDIDAARALVDSSRCAELFLYRGTEHLFADSSLPAYDPAAAALLTERVLAFLDKVQTSEKD
jgi:dienelactone hydrolase